MFTIFLARVKKPPKAYVTKPIFYLKKAGLEWVMKKQLGLSRGIFFNGFINF